MAGDERLQPGPMAYLGVISAARREHLNQTELYARINDYADARGWKLPPGGARAFNGLQASENSLTLAAERLSRARPSDVLTTEHVGQLAYGQVAPGTRAVRVFDVRVNYNATGTAGESSDYITLRYTGGLPPTVGELIEEAQDVASSLVEGYGRQLVSWGPVEIGEL